MIIFTALANLTHSHSVGDKEYCIIGGLAGLQVAEVKTGKIIRQILICVHEHYFPASIDEMHKQFK